MAEIQQSVSAEPTDIIEFVSSNVPQMPRGSGSIQGFIELILSEKWPLFSGGSTCTWKGPFAHKVS